MSTASSSRSPLRIGILGAARIAPMALVRPAAKLDEVEVVAVAARDPARARKFAAKHGIKRVHEGYSALLADSEVDAIYNPLPNGLHCEWTVLALEAGKHVLCEKPIAANQFEAERMRAAAEKSGLTLVEAFHWRYHPLADRMREILDAGEIGAIRHVEVVTAAPMPIPGDIRYRYDLAGGASMDIGCYAVNILRFLAGEEPEVVRAEPRFSSPDVDRYMSADYAFPSGFTGRTIASMLSARLLQVSARVDGEKGRLSVLNPLMPHIYHRLVVRNEKGKRVERVKGDSTYTSQLRAFVRAVRSGEPALTDAAGGVANMRVIDSIYRRAGMKLRGSAA